MLYIHIYVYNNHMIYWISDITVDDYECQMNNYNMHTDYKVLSYEHKS